jgi:pimeloyl-ACP methyl ester carboxylesterase
VQLTLATGQTIAFDRHGDEAADAIVLLHGLSGSRTGYDAVVAHLVGRGELQVLNVDLRGHGESAHADPAGYDARTYADDIAELVDTLVARPVLVVGHSLGGVVAGALAAARPDLVRGLFLEDPPYFEGDADVRNASPVATFFPKMVAAVRALQARRAPAIDYEPMVAATTPPDDVAARCEGLTRWDPATMQAAIDGAVWSTFDPDAAVACALTVLRADPACGAVFKAEDAPRLLAANPHARIVMVDGATHSIHGTPTRDAYLAQLDLFLAASRGRT